MTLNEFIIDALEKENGFLIDALDGLAAEELAWQPAPDANSIGWILWHMVRVEDMWIQFFAQFQTELWETEGWHEKFGLPTRDNGFGHTAEQVNNFPGVDLEQFLQYRSSVRASTLAYLDTLSPDDMETVPAGKGAPKCPWAPCSARSSAKCTNTSATSPTCVAFRESEAISVAEQFRTAYCRDPILGDQRHTRSHSVLYAARRRTTRTRTTPRRSFQDHGSDGRARPKGMLRAVPPDVLDRRRLILL